MIPPASSTHRRGARAIAIPPASSTVSIDRTPPASSIVAIERRRAQLGLSHAELCRRAGVDRDGWRALRGGAQKPIARTLARLERALEAERPAVPGAIAALFRAAFGLVAQAQGLDDTVLAVVLDFSAEKPRDPAWLAMARARRLAIYLVTVELEIPNADLARALGCSRQNVKQARDTVEGWRDQAQIDALIVNVARALGRP